MPRRPVTPQRRARNSLTFAVAGAGAAFAGLTVAQNSLSALDPGPTPLVQVVLVLVVFLLGLILRRAQTLRQRLQTLDGLLRHWPLTTLSATAPHELGVLTSRAADTPYIPRDIDSELDDALARARVVLIYGPPLAGKSRTAYESAMRVAGERKVAIPETDDAVGEIWPLLEMARGSSPIFLWLDGLERYVEAITGDALSDIQAADPPITLVATIRETAYEGAIGGSEEETRAARLVRERARGVQLPDRLSEEEVARAHELYPKVPFDKPVGEVLTGALAGGHLPHSPADAAGGGPGRYAHLSDRWLVIPVVLCGVLLILVGVLLATGDFLEEEQNEPNARSPVVGHVDKTWAGR